MISYEPEVNTAMLVAVTAACMARGCTPEQTALVFQELQEARPPRMVSAIQIQLEEAIARAKEIPL